MTGEGLLAGIAFSLTVFFLVVWVLRRQRRTGLVELLDRIDRGNPESPIGKAGSLRGVQEKLFRRRSARRKLAQGDLSSMCIEVASRLGVGSDVPSAWESTWTRRFGERDVELSPEGLPVALMDQETKPAELVIAATRFSALTGSPLATVLRGTARSLTLLEEGAAAQKVAFSGPRLSAKVLTALPLVGIVAAELLGAHPISWFFSGSFPATIGIVGILLTVLGLLISQRMINSASKEGLDALAAPIVSDLAASGLRGGTSIPAVLENLGVALGDEEYGRIGRELLLGATWEEAWSPTPRGGELIASSLQPGWEDGVSPVELLSQEANDARRRSASQAETSAQELAVKLALPLAGFFLPAFVLLGLVPVFFALVGTQLVPGG